MVDGSANKSGDGGGGDEGKILAPHELDITDSEYVEQIDEGRFVVSPDTQRGGQSGGSNQNQAESAGQSGNQPGGGPLAGGSQPQSGSPFSGGGGNSQGPRRKKRTSKSQGGKLSEERVRRWLREHYKRSNSKYAFDVTAQFEGSVSQRKMASNDLITVFESLMLWYAQQVDSNMPVEEVLGILLMESNVPVRYPPESVKNLVKSTNLGPDDTIADLLEAVQKDDGVQL